MNILLRAARLVGQNEKKAITLNFGILYSKYE